MKRILSVAFLILHIASSGSKAQRLPEKTLSTIERAMSDELQRAKSELKLAGLVDPFFISYSVTDHFSLNIKATNGALVSADDNQSRMHNVRLLVGDYKFNDENFSDNSSIFSFNSSPDNALPLDDDYTGIRRSLWLTTDYLFKQANETLTKKRAALEHKQLSEDIKDLADFAPATPVQSSAAAKPFTLEQEALESLVRDLSRVFNDYPEIQSSSVSLSATDAYQLLQNTEGAHVRKPVRYVELSAQAFTQAADDAEPLSLSFSTAAADLVALPTRAELMANIQALARNLVALRVAPRFDEKQYAGPVLFTGEAARDFIGENLISRLSAKREDALGGPDVSALFGGGKKSSLKEKLGTRVLPTSVSVTDRTAGQRAQTLQDRLGYYTVDDEGVAPLPDLKLIEKGILKTLYMTRTPTKEVREPNGHARSLAGGVPGMEESVPAPGIVEIFDQKAQSSEAMRKLLFERARENGYNFALIVRQLQPSGFSSDEGGANFNDLVAGGKFIVPAQLYKVDLKTGKEQLVRSAQISPPQTRDLRELVMSKEAVTTDMMMPVSGGGFFSLNARVPSTYIGPRDVLCIELEVERKKTSANPTLPVVAQP